MNTENIIEYIRRGVGLKFSKAFYWIEAFSLFMMSGGMMMAGMSCGGHPEFWRIATFAANIILIVCTMIFVRKKSPLKYKLIVGGVSFCMYTCFFSFFFALLFPELNLPVVSIEFCYMIVALIPTFLLLFYSVRLNGTKPLFSKKIKIKNVSMSKTRGQMALGTLILGIIVVYLGHMIPNVVFTVALFGAFIFAYCFIPTGILDFQRFYYYTKLEKMGLVTEDILKVED